ncbi:MAG: class I tRNA ligase family protein, partial [Nanoarchaeota archaeon]
MKFPEYKHVELEQQIVQYWQSNKILEKLRAKNKKKPKFYFLQGPPYTSGRVHLGTAWNMALKDMLLRYKRMQGLNVWDRMGYDMHGLPTEQKVMAKLNLKTKEDIEKFGLKKFTEECEKFCTEMMQQMNTDFIRLGSTLDFTDPYQPIRKEFMEAEWWLITQAHKKGRLYQGLRTMHWDAATQSAVAKHELEYKQVTDTSIYMKFPHRTRKNTFFIIWTTTPWTIPLNLALMVHPELYYAEVNVNGETWIIAKDRVQHMLNTAGYEEYTISKEYQGKELEGQYYDHPLNIKSFLPQDLQKNPCLFSVLLSADYVDALSGTGLVHCAPGCGPEDYEVGHQYHIPPFNCVNEEGLFTHFGPFTGWRAKLDDKKFIDAIEQSGSLLAKEPYSHEYPHGERSHQPVIFRTTKQWFFKVEDLKEKMLAANEKVYWNPQGGKNAFTSWLENLRDNSITKQRYWGTPVPIWQAEDGDYIVVGSVEELEKLSKMKVKNMHIPDIDQITITKNKKTYKRIPDVLDVWIDAGTVSWNCL